MRLISTISKFFTGLCFFLLPLALHAASGPGSEGASFLDIPVGARPAAFGAAYTPVASDAYAPVWNPGGLGFVDSDQLAVQHISYLENIRYEFASYVNELGKGRALGASIQYLGSGDIAGTDISGNPAGNFSTTYAAYSLAYGQSYKDKLSLGLTGKVITGKIGNVGANAYAIDLGGMYQVNKDLRFASTLTNLGSKLTFIGQEDPLPLALHLGGVYSMPQYHLTSALEGVFPQTGLFSAHAGLEWSPNTYLSFRVGYRTDTVKGLSALAGLTTGLGIKLNGYEFSYAFVPLDQLGNTQYFSLVTRFGVKK